MGSETELNTAIVEIFPMVDSISFLCYHYQAALVFIDEAVILQDVAMPHV